MYGASDEPKVGPWLIPGPMCLASQPQHNLTHLTMLLPQDDNPANGGVGTSSDRKASARVKVLYFTEQLEDVFLLGEETPQVGKRRPTAVSRSPGKA